MAKSIRSKKMKQHRALFRVALTKPHEDQRTERLAARLMTDLDPAIVYSSTTNTSMEDIEQASVPVLVQKTLNNSNNISKRGRKKKGDKLPTWFN